MLAEHTDERERSADLEPQVLAEQQCLELHEPYHDVVQRSPSSRIHDRGYFFFLGGLTTFFGLAGSVFAIRVTVAVTVEPGPPFVTVVVP